MNNYAATLPGTSLNRYLPTPKNGNQCPISGMGHARFYAKVINGEGRKHVRIVDMKEPNQSRGTKFYHAGDLLCWLNSLAEQLNTTGDAAKRQTRDQCEDGDCRERKLCDDPDGVSEKECEEQTKLGQERPKSKGLRDTAAAAKGTQRNGKSLGSCKT